MCSLGTFIREADTGVIPLFALRTWILSGTQQERAHVATVAWRPTQTTHPSLTSALRSLGATKLPIPPAVALPRIGPPWDGEAVGHLQSLNGAIWPPNHAFRAVCETNRHGTQIVPSQDCSCGVYAYRHVATIREMALRSSLTGLVVGLVALWGTVLEYATGYRAQMAYSAALLVPPDLDGANRESLERCARLYRVPMFGTAEEGRGDALFPALR